ncbi:RdgB/HAM1 family non-canonical purine NTP pyrophosphatase [Puniceicoccus vermicola]|uniref:dITP/XTP pyrophosphatase n=1 Tax=Puniceicoccus vermicola TaxID=388746 RepID=A0A7X1AUK7_9BACT|nr:RdgB/HAM1 family non-canonical purine NTP pyrophosphatase [Puniceicoccus vermicola]MBC2600293.1 RdgB/HAM1 family non-canonical purine NTP pyrophosphatase [Puniceicoccus vermicola]
MITETSVDIVLASGNAHKAEEIQAWLRERGHSVSVLTASHFGGMKGCEETATDFEGNARIKVEFLQKRVSPQTWILADDSGLEVDALDGAPGVFSARFAGEGADDQQNRELLIERMRKVAQPRRRTARFVCVLALWKGKGSIQFFRGECEGRILRQSKGEGGFGYDPVFAPSGSRQSFAEIDPEEKNRISHRGQALEKLEKELTA